MMERYEEESYELAVNLRAGSRFIECAKVLYDGLNHIPHPRHVKLQDKFKALRSAIECVIKLWGEHEKTRPPFSIPAGMKNDYQLAKRRYLYMKSNPENFYKKDMKDHEELEKEKNMLAAKIADKELKLSRLEDDRRHEIRDKRARISSKLNVLNNEKKKLEGLKDKTRPSCLSACIGKNKEKLPAVLHDIAQMEAQLESLDKQVNPMLENKQYQLTLLRRRRWDVNKALNTHNDSHVQRATRWQTAVDNAEIVMMVKSMDIDDAAKRYYSSEPIDIMHAFLNVYGLVQEIVAQPIVPNELIKKQLLMLTECAREINAPSIGDRNIETLYKKLLLLSEEEKHKVIYLQPEKGHLPMTLLRTLSVRHLKKEDDVLGLYHITATVKDLSVINDEESRASHAPK